LKQSKPSRKLTKTDASQAERFLQVESTLQAGLEGNPQKLQLPPCQVGSITVLPHIMRKPLAKIELRLKVEGLEGHNKTTNFPLWLAKRVLLGEALPPERPQTWGASH
jgi:hypothetical protein